MESHVVSKIRVVSRGVVDKSRLRSNGEREVLLAEAMRVLIGVPPAEGIGVPPAERIEVPLIEAIEVPLIRVPLIGVPLAKAIGVPLIGVPLAEANTTNLNKSKFILLVDEGHHPAIYLNDESQ